jgi:hypothetical protein
MGILRKVGTKESSQLRLDPGDGAQSAQAGPGGWSTVGSGWTGGCCQGTEGRHGHFVCLDVVIKILGTAVQLGSLG